MDVTVDLILPALGLAGGEVIEVRNPADADEVVGTFLAATPAQLDGAVAAATRAQRGWARRPMDERIDALRRAVPKIETLLDLDTLLVRENGKMLWEATFEVGFYEMAVEAFAPYAESLSEGRRIVDDGMGKIDVFHEPYGVVGAITPWNYPIAISAIKVVPALLAGNAVVVVASPSAPLAMLRVYREVADQLPEGLLTVLSGPGAEIGHALCTHPDVPKVAFTGSTQTGKLIAASVATGLKDLTLELGGNDAALILDDATIDANLCGELLGGAFTTTGQICMGVKRVYVPRAKHEQLVAGMVALLDDYVVGNGLDPDATMGPLHLRAQRDRVVDLVGDARAGGARVDTGGEMTGDPDRGWFLLPSIVSDVDHKSRIVQEEQFGPALPIVAYDDLDQAIDMVNDTIYGLDSSIWTADEDRAVELARRIEAGSTWINSHHLFSVDPRSPFGGWKQSGTGREMGLEGLVDYTQLHAVSTRHM